jgi:GntR family transcriptional regulator
VNSNAPRYLNIEAILREEIGVLAANSVLPTELQLARRFAVSRITIRRALDMLERSGLISRQRGRGTIVSPPKITRRFSPLYPFEQDLRDQGVKFETQLLAYDLKIDPPESIRQRLQLPAPAKVGFLSLVRRVDDRIICHDRRYFPHFIARKLGPKLVQLGDLLGVIEKLEGKPVQSTDWESEIVPSSSEMADALEITPGTLVVANTFTYYFADGTPAEAGLMAYRIDRCKFKFGGRFNEPVVQAARRRLA